MQTGPNTRSIEPKIKLLADGRLNLLLYNTPVCPCQRQRQTQTRSMSSTMRRNFNRLLTFPAAFLPYSNHSILDQKARYGRMNTDVYTTLQQTTMNYNIYHISALHISQRDKFHAPSSPAQIVHPATPTGTSPGPRHHSAPPWQHCQRITTRWPDFIHTLALAGEKGMAHYTRVGWLFEVPSLSRK